MSERTPQHDLELERMLESLPTRRPPAELRGRVLSQLQCDSAQPTRTSRSFMAIPWERALNVALVLLVVAAPLSWLANSHFQDQTMTRLMGPTPAERQARRVVESMHLANAEHDSRSLRNELVGAIETRDHKSDGLVCIHSLGYAGYLIAEHSK